MIVVNSYGRDRVQLEHVGNSSNSGILSDSMSPSHVFAAIMCSLEIVWHVILLCLP